jgi:hypothetical protein
MSDPSVPPVEDGGVVHDPSGLPIEYTGPFYTPRKTLPPLVINGAGAGRFELTEAGEDE